MKNVAIFGPMYAGKSTIADALTEAGYHRMSQAAPIKNIAALAYGKFGKTDTITTTSRDGQVVEKSGREIYQQVGQFIKDMDRDFWLKCFIRDAKNYGDTPLSVDDGRFIFEFEALAEAGWLTVGIETPLHVRMQRAVLLSGREPTEAELNHESERDLPEIIDRCDIVVDGTVDPYENVKVILDGARN